MGYRVHFIGLKVNKNLDWELALLLSVYTWCLNEKLPELRRCIKICNLYSQEVAYGYNFFLRLAFWQFSLKHGTLFRLCFWNHNQIKGTYEFF
jgi:hypothetical protein